MDADTLSKKERDFLCHVNQYVQGDISRRLYYMDIDALAREIDASKDDIYAIAQKLGRYGFIEVKVAGYLEIVMIKLTPNGRAYIGAFRKNEPSA